MRGQKKTQQSMLSLRTPEQRVPKGHPLRRIKAMADKALEALNGKPDVVMLRSDRDGGASMIGMRRRPQ